MSTTSFGSLPDDLILDIVQHLDTARDAAHFSASSKWTNRIMQHRGWRDFVRTKFSSLRLPDPIHVHGPNPNDDMTSWAALADRLTYQERCWSKRAFRLTIFDEVPRWNRARGRGFRQQSVGFESVVAASGGLLVCGAGEDVVLRRRECVGGGGKESDVWAKLRGRDGGYAPGTGDVTATTIIRRGRGGSAPEIVVGRATGDLQLMSADSATLGLSSQELRPDGQTMGMRRSPGQAAVSWTEWEGRNQVLASCRGSCLTLHDLADTQTTVLLPVVHHDVARENPADETSLLRSVKFLGPDTLACAMGGCRQPLKWAQLRPEGELQFHIPQTASAREEIQEKTTVRAVEPVPGMNPHILLSAWDDGSHRLSDLRTPLSCAALYRDRFQPYQASSSLLVYGADRFVAGNNWGPNVRFFDFRSPRPYQHLDALPCSALPPTPGRPFSSSHVFHDQDGHDLPGQDLASLCDYTRGRRCTRHHLSRQQSWQPDAMLDTGRPSLDRVTSLAKSSDTSPAFFVGFRGAMVEASLELAEDRLDRQGRNISVDAPEGWRGMPLRGRVSLLETGIGLCGERDAVEELTGVPQLYYHEPWTAGRHEPWTRLDGAYRTSSGGFSVLFDRSH